jgi:hypothetical protein
LEVAKVNLWLESVKVSSFDFRWVNQPETNRMLPDLEMNLTNGEAIVGLPDQQAIEILSRKHKEELEELSRLRDSYLRNPVSCW